MYDPKKVSEVSERFALKNPPKLYGFRRKNGAAGFRNHLLVLSTVICANKVIQDVAYRYPDVVAIPQESGCMVLPNETERIRTTFLSMAKNPNVGAVLFVGLGCENIDAGWLYEQMKDEKPAAFARIQDEGSSMEAADKVSRMIESMKAQLDRQRREEVPFDKLILGSKCGGSDWTSASVSNPCIGHVSDLVVKAGGVSLLGETQGWFGGEEVLVRRARSRAVADRIVALLDDIYDRSLAVGRRIEEGNPSPGNKAGGITTLVEKALGNVKKSGTAPVEDVLYFGGQPAGKGLYALENPGLDPVSLLGLTCSSANVILFSTGRGTPTGTPLAPAIKISASPHTCKTFSKHLDVDLSGVIEGRLGIEEAGMMLFTETVAVANGKLTKAELYGHREFAMPLLMGPM